ncbi:hypothetical protein BJ684DRAFT_20528 [Piptocephalis cylindrospora]|uniref:Uncharacterized protein n=1 Tax=Piptocephalis cylindrospora TaxID=1907219 RepID=A0A4P9Y252_9FUNG|nr:hypothetical protein BJ684DRAFT_20528 [Piptocephalis cylindrospora]|eukprot:RKP12956.1 hypothetical protein BJ684DRAFT_20528 [Piptocephalis cylindrospora]
MDLTKDSLYNWEIPANTPCRWTVNVTQCIDSEYYCTVALISLILACFLLPTTCSILYLSRIKRKDWTRPWRWSGALIYYASIGLASVFIIVFDVLVYVDVQGSYWTRYFFFEGSFTIIFLGLTPFFRTLTAPTSMRLPTGEREKPSWMHRIIQGFPLLVIVSCIIVIFRGVFMDWNMSWASDLVASIGLSLTFLITLIISYVCGVHGHRFSSLLNDRILSVEERTNQGQHPIYVVQPTSRGQSVVRSASRVNLTSSPTSSISEAPRSQEGHTDRPFPTKCSYQHRSPPINMTIVEARAVVLKITFVNAFLCIASTLSSAISLIMAILPSRLFTIIPLSKFIFTFVQIGIPLTLEFTMICNLYTELRRRRLNDNLLQSHHEITLLDQAKSIHHSVAFASRYNGTDAEHMGDEEDEIRVEEVVEEEEDEVFRILGSNYYYLDDWGLPRTKGRAWLRPWTWNTTSIYYVSMGLTGSAYMLYAIIVYVDVPSPYWPRHMLFDLPYTLVLLGVVPILHTLTAPSSLSLPSGGHGIHARPSIMYRLVQGLPVIILLAMILVFFRALLTDWEMNLASDICTSISLSLTCITTLFMSYTCYVHGRRFSALLSERILSIEEQAESRQSIPIYPISELHSSTRSFSHIGSSQMGMSRADPSRPNAPPLRARVTLTTNEARAVLLKAVYVNTIIALAAALSCIVSFLMAILPSRVFAILPLSKAAFISVQVAVPGLLEATLACNLYTEYCRRRTNQALCEAQRSISLFDQAKSLHHTIIHSNGTEGSQTVLVEGTILIEEEDTFAETDCS